MIVVSYGMTLSSCWCSILFYCPGICVNMSGMSTLGRDAGAWSGIYGLLYLWVCHTLGGGTVVFLGGDFWLGDWLCFTPVSGTVGIFLVSALLFWKWLWADVVPPLVCFPGVWYGFLVLGVARCWWDPLPHSLIDLMGGVLVVLLYLVRIISGSRISTRLTWECRMSGSHSGVSLGACTIIHDCVGPMCHGCVYFYIPQLLVMGETWGWGWSQTTHWVLCRYTNWGWLFGGVGYWELSTPDQGVGPSSPWEIIGL